MLTELHDTLRKAGVHLAFAEMKGPVKDKLKHFGIFEQLAGDSFFYTIDEAVAAYRAAHPPGRSTT
jgi:hypothetical protein